MTEKPFLRVKNWEQFQPWRYRRGNSQRPHFIAVHTALLSDIEFLTLPPQQAMTLLIFWMATGLAGNGRLPNSVQGLTLILPLDHDRVAADIPALVEGGWLIPCTKEEADRFKAKEKPGPQASEDPDAPDEIDAETKAAVAKVVDLWNELDISPKIVGRLRPNTNRFKWCVARIRERGIDAVLEMVRKRAASSFLSHPPGSGKHRNWKATFEWCVRAANFDKIMEGNFDDKGRKRPIEDTIRRPTADDYEGGDLLQASRCADRRGLNSERMTREELFALLDDDLKTVMDEAKRKGKHFPPDVYIGDMMEWFHNEMGVWPHELPF